MHVLYFICVLTLHRTGTAPRRALGVGRFQLRVLDLIGVQLRLGTQIIKHSRVTAPLRALGEGGVRLQLRVLDLIGVQFRLRVAHTCWYGSSYGKNIFGAN